LANVLFKKFTILDNVEYMLVGEPVTHVTSILWSLTLVCII